MIVISKKVTNRKQVQLHQMRKQNMRSLIKRRIKTTLVFGIITTLLLVFSACNKSSDKTSDQILLEQSDGNDDSKNMNSSIDENKTIDDKLYVGEYNYCFGGVGPDIKTEYYYSDSYFKNSGKENNEHLRTMSMNLALAATPTSSGKKDRNIIDLMTQIGFQDVICEDMENETTKDTIGSAISHKNLNGTEVVAVAIRGDGYQAEWASNMMIGNSGDEEGFSDASQKIINRIRDYQEKYHLKEIKIWISGYSRAGGVANLTGKYIIEHLSEFDINNDDDVYVYTFEAPNSSGDDVIYDSIHNVINVNDFIPYIPFEKWGLYCNGQKEYIGDDIQITKKSTSLFNGRNQNKQKKEDSSKNDTEESKSNGTESISMTEFLSETADWLADTIDREDGAESMSFVSKLIELAFTKTPDELKETIEYFKLVGQSIVKDTSKAEWTKLILTFTLSGSGIRVDVTREIADLITSHMDLVKEEHGISFSEEEYEVLKESVLPLLNLLQPIISSDAPEFTHLLTIADNSFTILCAHFTTVNLALLQEEDSYYTDEVEAISVGEME